MCAIEVFWKDWEKEKLLITNNLSFSHSLFYPFGALCAIFIEFEIIVYKLFQFRRVQNLLFGKGLTHYKLLDKSKFKTFGEDKLNMTGKTEMGGGIGRNYQWKRTKCWLTAFSPLSIVFSKGFFFQGWKVVNLVHQVYHTTKIRSNLRHFSMQSFRNDVCPMDISRKTRPV